jgi:glycerol-3-phosphate dehydrogenase
VLINAAGPFADDHNRLTGEQTEHHHAFSKGIHLIVGSRPTRGFPPSSPTTGGCSS